MKNYSVLVLDDDRSIVKLVTYHLKHFGYRVHQTNRASEALEVLENFHPDLIIADIVMPEMDGLEFCREVRSKPDYTLMPFIFMTGRDTLDRKIRALESGGDFYITKPFSSRELNAVVARAIERQELHRATSEFDSLTAVHNRGYFDRQIQIEIGRIRRYEQILSLVIFDIDHFKNFNDSYGHQAGDFILKSLAQMIKGKLRDADVICRYGGEEFVILMPFTTKYESFVVIERIRQLVEITKFNFMKGSLELNVTISAGIAESPKDAQTGYDLVQRADFALYRAKEGGRNQVILYKP
jgi:diguanylate cyclase (GGDEF)-like protein